VDSPTFLNQVREHGFLSEEQLASVSKRFGSAGSFHELTAALVDQGWLTPYQVEQIWAGKAKGLVLGQYRILTELGRGGFGCVFKAQHLIMNRLVALKVISPEMVDDSRARAWFRREVLASTQFQHPNIVMAFDANEVDDVLFLVMEYVDGPNLAEAVKKQGPLPIGLACSLMLQAASGLQYAHEKGMVHRDIKPANLLLPRAALTEETDRPAAVLSTTSPVLVKIVDFGLARLQTQATPNTLMGVKEKGFVGTPDFISPEQARNIHEVDIRADLYSLGCTFYFALSGRPPFKGKNPLEIVLQHLEREPPDLTTLRPEVPPALASIVRRLMAKKPEQRFQTPGDLARELNFFFGSGAALAPPSAAPGTLLHREINKPASPAAKGKSPVRVTPLPSLAVAPSTGPTDSATGDAELDLPKTVLVAAVSDIPEQNEPLSEPALIGRDVPGGDTECANSHTDEPCRHERHAESLPTEFAKLWRQWTNVIEDLFERREPALSAGAYGALHADLLMAVRIQAKDRQDGPVFGMVEAAVAPWLSLPTLSQTDHQTLSSLRSRCRQLEQKLSLGRPARRLSAWAFVAALFLAASLAGIFLIKTGDSLTQHGVANAWRLVIAHPIAALALTVPILVFGSAYVFSRFPRS
jgi:serine/threonine protein kinase